MDWVQATGKTVDEAKEAALDLLGIDASDAEFEVLEEAKTGLFGRMKSEARVRARIKPSTPRPKTERRDRRRGGKDGGRDGARDSKDQGASGAKEGRESRGQKDSAKPRNESGGQGRARNDRGSEAGGAGRERGARNGRAESGSTTKAASGPSAEGGATVNEGMSVDEQAEKAEEFLTGLLSTFGISGSMERVAVDDDTREINVSGEAVGILVGPRGRTLEALQDVVRTVVQRHAGPSDKRVRVDVAGYRQRRREALAAFAVSVAETVRDSGVARALEPMSSPDRKVVHDALVGVEGVVTSSEGEDPRRRVVISPSMTAARADEIVEAPDATEAPEAPELEPAEVAAVDAEG